MVFEDETHYEGEFKSAGIFGGKGVLTFPSGDKLEGNIYGAWNEPVKVTATLNINKASDDRKANIKPPSFGKICVPPDQKWKAIFRQCYQQLGVTEPNTSRSANSNDKTTDYQRLWQNVAIIVSKFHQKALQRDSRSPSKNSDNEKKRNISDLLSKIPQFGKEKLTFSTYGEVHEYLQNACECSYHPLGALLTELAAVYTATYGGVRVHPLLLSHAVDELHSIMSRIYEIVVLFFPALPRGGKECTLEPDGGGER